MNKSDGSSRSQYLEMLWDYLYGDLRPRILHEPRLTVLCEVCTVLQALMMLDQPIDDETEEDGEKNEELGRLFDDYCRWFCKTHKRGYSSRLSQ